MRLLFDHGTLVLADAPDLSRKDIPGLLWDPRVALYRAPAHRHAEVVQALAALRLPFVDAVLPATRAPTGVWTMPELRPYQEAALVAWDLAEGRGVVALPTGSGKTRVAAAALAQSTVPAICLVPTRALLNQWLKELPAFYSGPIGCLGDGRQQVEDVTVATFESAYRWMPRIGNRFDLLVVDEAHHFGSGARDEALEMCTASRRLGLSATPPDGTQRQRLAQLLGPVVFQLGLADLAGKWLAEFELVVLRVGLNREERERYELDHRLFAEVNRRFRALHPYGTWQELVSAATQTPEGRAALDAWRRTKQLLGFTRAKAEAVRALLSRHRDSKVLLFTADNAAAYAIAREHLIMPLTCEIGRRERERVLQAFREGTLRALVSSRVLNEGIDVPDADVAIVVGGTLGQREHVQRIGRLLRPAPGKRAIVYELVTLDTSEAWRAAERRRGLGRQTSASA
ncbi:MAG TPA: DEAD/DEAH box helicase family protein [Polyangiaceae bacterium]|nr:DEAD/DEAH box helicase family protein [Polyangiaceae bacterium]